MSDFFVTSWTVAGQAPLSLGFSWQEYWSGLPLPTPGESSGTPEIKAASLVSPALAGGFITTSTPWEAKHTCVGVQITVASLLVCK